ncbi:MAG: PepSY-like domain-containing protein [Saprospiraceae bacterium]|nr:PepSY-like domain-containing protein [Saprospiraceae bacterium]
MKITKFIPGVLTLAAVLTFSACQKNNLIPQSDVLTLIAYSGEKEAVEVDQLPSSIQTFLEKNYAPIFAEIAYRVDALGYEVVLEDDQYLYFNVENNCIGDGDMIGQLGNGHPHPGGMHPHPGGPHPGGPFPGMHCHCMMGDTITATGLPQGAIDYITDNYPDETIEVVVSKMSTKYAVELSDGTKLLFNENGLFIKECGNFGIGGGNWPGGEMIDAASLPATVADYLAANYSDETLMVAFLRPNGNYFLKLSNGVIIIFDADGNMLFDSGN